MGEYASAALLTPHALPLTVDGGMRTRQARAGDPIAAAVARFGFGRRPADKRALARALDESVCEGRVEAARGAARGGGGWPAAVLGGVRRLLRLAVVAACGAAAGRRWDGGRGG
jgi:hypothetical protein